MWGGGRGAGWGEWGTRRGCWWDGQRLYEGMQTGGVGVALDLCWGSGGCRAVYRGTLTGAGRVGCILCGRREWPTNLVGFCAARVQLSGGGLCGVCCWGLADHGCAGCCCCCLRCLDALITMGVLVPTGDRLAVRRTAQFFLNSFQVRPEQKQTLLLPLLLPLLQIFDTSLL